MVNSNNKELYVVKPTRFVVAPGKDKLVSRNRVLAVW